MLASRWQCGCGGKVRRVLGSEAALSGMLGGEWGVAVGRERRPVRGSRLWVAR